MITWFNVIVSQRPTLLRVVKRGNFGGDKSPGTTAGACENSQAANAGFPCVILVNPHLDQNVGSVARSMLNFGLTELRLDISTLE